MKSSALMFSFPKLTNQVFDMASSSSSSRKPIKHEVFLSFRGVDTRHNFTSHLHASLRRHGIVTFIDNRLDRGEEIEPAILKAIEESYISVVILSKNYATSPWCLDELVKIFECKDMGEHKVIPLFYHVDPTDVDKQTGCFGEALAKHKNADKVRIWRNVLSRAANLSGEVITESRLESKFVEVVVKGILKHLKYDHSSYGFKNLVGMQLRVSQVESLLCIGLNDVRIIGIWGMGGIGKTTISEVVYQKYASQFEGSCFLENVRDHSLPQLQNELLVQLLNEGIASSRLMSGIRPLRYKKLLIVLDNVDDYEEIEFLAGEHNWFGEGSRIIITSRDKSVFQNRDDWIYEVEPLADQEALHLLSLCAFKENRPERGVMVLSKKVVSYARGNPLALKVLGLFLYGKSKEEWRSELKRLEKVPEKKIQDMLKISYEGLDCHDQQIFLNIAFMFKGEPISHIIDLLDACGSSTLIGLRRLADKSLIIMSNGKVDMHDLLQEMGRHIICQESEEAGKRSRLWNPEDIYHVLTKNTGSDAIEGICLDNTKLTKVLSLRPKVFADMNGMKLFKFHNLDNNVDKAWHFEEVELVPNNVIIPEGLKYLPNELRLLQWQFYPEKYLPSNFKGEKLVELNLSGSCVRRLWKGVQDLPNLKDIKLCHCRQLVEFPNLSGALNLEKIDCVGCVSLIKVCPSIGCLNNLYLLDLRHCYKITSVPSAKALRYLSLQYCPINNFPEVPTTIEYLNLSSTKIENIPCSIRFLSRLVKLSLGGCKKLKNLPESLFQLKHLQFLSLGPDVNILSQVENTLPSLKLLCLSRCEMEILPSSVRVMSCLRQLDLTCSTGLRSLINLPPNLQFLYASHCTSLNIVSVSLIGLQLCWGKLVFADCTSLNQKEIRSILRHAQRRILHLAHTPPKLLKEWDSIVKNKHELGGQFVVIFPGNNIPKWIGHQGRGFSITIALPPNWLHNFLGFVVGAVFALDLSHKLNYNWMRLETQFKSKRDGTSFDCIPATFIICNGRTDSRREQVVLWYHKYFSFKDEQQIRDSISCYDEAFLSFSFEDSYGKPLPSYMIKKCGVQLLYNSGVDKIAPNSAQSILKLDAKHVDSFEDYYNYVENEPSSSNILNSRHPNEGAPFASPKQVDAQPIPLKKKKSMHLNFFCL